LAGQRSFPVWQSPAQWFSRPQ